MLTAERLRDVVRYDPDTGYFTWLVRQGSQCAGDRAGTRGRHGYVSIAVDGKIYKAGRLAWLYMTGQWPTYNMDHINRNRGDNRFCNLREATDAQNCMNKRGSGMSGFKGVYWEPHCGFWAARFTSRKMKVRLGLYKTKEEAARAYDKKAKEVFGSFALLNFPESV